MIDFQDLGAKVAFRRREFKLSQSDLAQRAGVVRQTIARIEGGAGDRVATGTLIAVLNALSYDLVLEFGIHEEVSEGDLFDLDSYLDEKYYGGADE